ncbi:ORF1 [torque teno Delphinidae virus 7]
MPYGYYRRRRRGYRRPYRFRYRRRWAARRQRYWSWRLRRPIYRWVRGTRRRRAFISRARRARIRKLRFLRWRNRWKYQRPVPIREFMPSVQVRCKIKGYGPLMYFNGKQLAWPFIDPQSYGYLGGGITFLDFTLNWLYMENLRKHNTWSRSNYGFEYGRFLGAKFVFYRHDNVSYIVKYFQGRQVTPQQTYMDIHPGILYGQKHRVIVAANDRVPFSRRFKRKRLRIRPPKNMTTEWYPLCYLGEHILVRLGATIADFLHPFQQCHSDETFFYYSVGYFTPDRRNLEKYKQSLEYNKCYTVTEINTWGPTWHTWGGPINIKLPYRGITGLCDKKYQELKCQTTESIPTCKPFQQSDTECTAPVGRESSSTCTEPYDSEYKPAYLISVRDRLYADSSHTVHAVIQDNKPMGQICCTTQTAELYSHMDYIYFGKLRAGIPYIDQFNSLKNSFSSHSSQYPLKQPDLMDNLRYQEDNQGFWPGRYNAQYDRGIGNCVYACYISHSDWANSSFKNMLNKNYGPGMGSKGHFSTIKCFQDMPYWLVFFGHNYKSFISYLNELYKDTVKNDSYGQLGFFAVGILLWPAEQVASGPFQQGYAPLKYVGYNAKYFLEKSKDKYWAATSNQPPTTPLGDVDYSAQVFVMLRDGRSTMYGSSLEGSLLTQPQTVYKAFFCKASVYSNPDDIASLGRSGPFIPYSGDKRFANICTNIFFKYIFYFKWGGYGRPPKQPLRDLKHDPSCDPEELPGARYKVRRDTSSQPVHPYEVSASAFHAPRDLGLDGILTNLALQRLTGFFPTTDILHGLRPSGRKTDNALFRAVGNLRRDYSVPTPTSETDSEGDPEEAARWRKEIFPFTEWLQPDQQALFEETPLSHAPRKRRSSDPSRGQDEIQGQQFWGPQPSRRRRRQLQQLLGIFESRQRDLHKLIKNMNKKKWLRRAVSTEHLECLSTFPGP